MHICSVSKITGMQVLQPWNSGKGWMVKMWVISECPIPFCKHEFWTNDVFFMRYCTTLCSGCALGSKTFEEIKTFLFIFWSLEWVEWSGWTGNVYFLYKKNEWDKTLYLLWFRLIEHIQKTSHHSHRTQRAMWLTVIEKSKHKNIREYEIGG